jgi:LysR family hydrogen peroxide-inducible transcriptional activator
MITLKKLRYFEAASRLRHFGKAAEECAVTQPALSMQILEMEKQLGVSLFRRRRDGLELTPEGTEILARARRVLAEMDMLNDYAKGLNGTRGTLKIGVIPTIGPYLLPRLIPALKETHPDFKLTIRETQTARLIEELAQGKVDLVIGAAPLDHPMLDGMELFDDRFLLASPASRPAPENGNGALQAFIASEQLLLLEEGHCLRDQALNHCDKAGVQYGEVYGTSNIATLIQLVAHGLGITLVPELCIEVEMVNDAVVLTRFSEPEPYRTVAMAWREASPRADHFRQIGMLARELGPEVQLH